MTDLLASLAWVGAVVFLVVRLDRWATRWLDLTHEAKQGTPVVEIPADLIAFSLQETEKWAQDATLKVIREKYDQYTDWNTVRAAVGIGAVD